MVRGRVAFIRELSHLQITPESARFVAPQLIYQSAGHKVAFIATKTEPEYAMNLNNALTKPYFSHIVSLVFAALLFAAAPRAQAESSNWNFGFSFNGKSVKGNGQIIQDARKLSGFDRIESRGSVDLVIKQGATESVVVEIDSNIAPLVTTTVENGKLIIDAKGNWATRSKIKVTVEVVNLSAVAVSGSGDVLARGLKLKQLAVNISGSGDARLEEFSAETLTASISGSGDFFATGKAANQTFSVAGSGDIRTDGLEGCNVSVSIAGSGDAKVWATQSLEVAVAGSGDVRYRGAPANLKKRIAGSGSVSQL